MYSVPIASPFGPVRLLWRLDAGKPRIARVFLPTDSWAQSAAGRTHPAVDALVALLGAYLGGAAVTLPLDLMDLDICSPFQRRVLLAEYAIPRGRVSTYGLIARHLGVPGAPRAVGRALATNPFPLFIPCHRAVRSDGSLGGYRGGLAMKRALLQMEGVAFDDDGRVRGPFYYGDDALSAGAKDTTHGARGNERDDGLLRAALRRVPGGHEYRQTERLGAR